MRQSLAPAKENKNRALFPILIVVLLACFQLPFSSFVADDLILLGILENVSPITWSGPWQLYTLADGNPVHMQQARESGAFPWFFHPRFQLRFFRPLSSALFALDHKLFGLRPLGYGLHNIIWLIILVWGAALLLKRFVPGPASLLAAVIYAASGVLATAAFWTACRHNLIAPALALWAFLALQQWQENGRFRFLALSLAGFSLAFLSSEAALAVVAYPLAQAFFAPANERKKRVKAVIPLLALTLLYLTLYCACGYGAGYGSEYQSPFTSPLSYLRVLPQRLATTFGFMFFGATVDMLAFTPASRPFLLAGGMLATLLLFFMLRYLWSAFSYAEKHSLRWLLAGSLISSLPFAASLTISFHMVVPFFGWAAVIALIIHSRSLPRQKRSDWQRPLCRLACTLLFIFHLLLAPLLRISLPWFMQQMLNKRVEQATQNLDQDFPRLANMRVIMLNAPDIAIGFHSYFYRRLNHLPMPAVWRVLYWGRESPRIRRTAENAFAMEFPGGEFRREGLRLHDATRLTGLEVVIDEMHGDIIRKISCTLDRPLDDPGLILLSWRAKRLIQVSMPAKDQALVLNNN